MPLKNYRFKQNIFGTKELEKTSSLFIICDRSDHKQFLDYLKSPFFGVDKESIILYKFLKKQHKIGTQNASIDKLLTQLQMAHLTVKAVKSYLNRKTNHLYLQLLDFLAHQKLKNDQVTKLQVLQERLHNQGTAEALSETSLDLQKLHDKFPPSLESLFNRLRAQHLAYYDFNTNHSRDGFKLITALKGQLDLFYLTTSLAYECEIKNLMLTFSDLNIDEEQMPVQKQSSVDIIRLFELYLAIHDDIGSFSLINFKYFSRLLINIHDDIDPVLRFIFCKHAINALANLVNNGGDEYKFRLLKWLKRRHDWTPSSVKKIDENEFLNLIIVSCHCDRIKFARQFSRKNASRLPEKHTVLAVQLGEAFCCFGEKQYSQTRAILNQYFRKFSTDQYSYTIRSKTLLIRACLTDELIGNNGYDEFLKIKDDLRKYIDRLPASISKIKLSGYKNFLAIVNKIFLLQKNRATYSKKLQQQEIEKLKLDIEKKTSLIAKIWLKEIVNIYF